MSGEFEVLEKLRRKYSLTRTGDDCAVLPKDDKTDLVMTADMLVEDIDFRVEWAGPADIGHKALAVSLSDVAAMGADPKWAMLSLGLPKWAWTDKWIDSFYEGWHGLARKFGVELVGGDISRTPDKIVIDSVVAGEVEKDGAVLRSTAKPGDLIFVTGKLGMACRGLLMLQSGGDFISGADRKMIESQLRPMPEIEAGKILQTQKLATAMIDVSDGVSSDLAHLCKASGVGACLYAKEIPGFSDFRHRRGVPDPVTYLLDAGEDFVLLFTADPKNFEAPEFRNFYNIGTITANIDIIELMAYGETRVLEPGGYRHF